MMEETSSSQGRTLVKISRIVETEVDAVNKRIQTRIKELKQFDTSNTNHFLDILLKVEEEFSLAKMRIQTRMMGMDKDGSHDSAAKQLKLQFVNKISPIVFPGDEIKGQEGASLEVALVDFSTGELVEVEPESSAMVEIVLLKGEHDTSEGDDWTTKEFEEKIAWDMDGKVPSLIVGTTRVKLQGGIGKIESIKLRHRAADVNPPVFRLGARVVDTVDRDRMKEAKTQPFSVGNYRKKYFLKHTSPAVTDEVSRLVNICRGGTIEKRLKDDGISTVGDFLIRLLTDPEGLKSIVRLAPKKWRDTINNARACRDNRMYCYTNLLRGTSATFNILGEVLGMYLHDQYTPTKCFSEYHKAETRKLLASACEHWGTVKAFDDEESLLQYLTASSSQERQRHELLRLSLEPFLSSFLPSTVPSEIRESSLRRSPSFGLMSTGNAEIIAETSQRKFPSSGLMGTRTSEMMRESSRQSNFSVQSMSPALNSGTGTDTDFSVDDLEIAEPLFQDYLSGDCLWNY